MEFEHVTFDLPHGTFHALQAGDPDGQPTIFLHGFPDHPPTAKPFLAELGPAPLKYYRAMLRLGMLGATRRLSQPIAVPLLQLHGADDGCILPQQVDDRHRFAASRALEVVPDLGHFLHIEAPEAIAERIAAWAE
jgi:pimeloyl-ACP methyl ester carboxylesterase